MDDLLSIVAIVVGFLVIGWICGPADQRRRPGPRDGDQAQPALVEPKAGRDGT